MEGRSKMTENVGRHLWTFPLQKSNLMAFGRVEFRKSDGFFIYFQVRLPGENNNTGQ